VRVIHLKDCFLGKQLPVVAMLRLEACQGILRCQSNSESGNPMLTPALRDHFLLRLKVRRHSGEPEGGAGAGGNMASTPRHLPRTEAVTVSSDDLGTKRWRDSHLQGG
jgi:hypothetical protein